MLLARHDLMMGSGAALATYVASSWLPIVAQNAPYFGAPSVVQVGFR